MYVQSIILGVMGGFVTPATKQKTFAHKEHLCTMEANSAWYRTFFILQMNNERIKNTIQRHGIELGNFNKGLLGPYKDVLTPEKLFQGGVTNKKKLEPFWSIDQ